MVQFTDATLHPTTARITADGNVVWINYASGKVGTVRFDSSLRDAFPCEMRPIFSEVAGAYQSIGISGDSENVTLPCTPKPGVYDYELELVDAMAGSPVGDLENPHSVMRGRIEVVP